MKALRDTLPSLLLNQVAVRGDDPAVREKNLGIWQEWTWRQVADEVAVITRPPAAAAPMQALIAECSLSTAMKFVGTLPSATNCEKFSTTWVEGVIG